MRSAWLRSLECNVCSSYLQTDAPFINCSGIGASIAIVLRSPHVKLVLLKSSMNINAVHDFAHTARNPFSKATVQEIRGTGLRGGAEIAVTLSAQLK
ncbi:hypothetical protein EVAR_83419_1 [Eumeta japonica]|uniref:Uncharacterized protein n=1 Tax=Eumeta variegata TaxID=151549 RepID=A0A4C1TZS4_EUMVA|nr:hypothetical protein EVAR_83419_1 [Eumeta japonica]